MIIVQYANVALIKDGNQVLLQHRDNKPTISYPDMWCLPGGRIEPGELPEQAAIREFEEETGYKLGEFRLFRKISYKFIDGIPEAYIFIAEYDEKQRISCFEGQEMKFVEANKIGELQLFPGHNAEFIKETLAAIKITEQ